MPTLHETAKKEFIDWIVANIDTLKDKNLTPEGWAKYVRKDPRVIEKILHEIKFTEIYPGVRFLPSTVPLLGYYLDPKQEAYHLSSAERSYEPSQVKITKVDLLGEVEAEKPFQLMIELSFSLAARTRILLVSDILKKYLLLSPSFSGISFYMEGTGSLTLPFHPGAPRTAGEHTLWVETSYFEGGEWHTADRRTLPVYVKWPEEEIYPKHACAPSYLTS